MSRTDVQAVGVSHPLRATPLPGRLVALRRPTLRVAPPRILQPDPEARARLDPQGQAPVLLEVPQDPAAGRRVLPRAAGMQEEAALEPEAGRAQDGMGRHEQDGQIQALGRDVGVVAVRG